MISWTIHSPWNSPSQNTGVGSLSLLLGFFSTQGSKPGLLHCMWIFYQLSHKGSPRMLEWVAYPFFQWIFLTQDNWITGVSCIAGDSLPTELSGKPNNLWVCEKQYICSICLYLWLLFLQVRDAIK